MQHLKSKSDNQDWLHRVSFYYAQFLYDSNWGDNLHHKALYMHPSHPKYIEAEQQQNEKLSAQNCRPLFFDMGHIIEHSLDKMKEIENKNENLSIKEKNMKNKEYKGTMKSVSSVTSNEKSQEQAMITTKASSGQEGGHRGSSVASNEKSQEQAMIITKASSGQQGGHRGSSVTSVASKDKLEEQAMVTTTKNNSGQEGGHRGSSVSSVQKKSNDNHSIKIMQELGTTKRKLSDSIKSYRRRIEKPTPHGQIISEVTTSIINDQQVESERISCIVANRPSSTHIYSSKYYVKQYKPRTPLMIRMINPKMTASEVEVSDDEPSIKRVIPKKRM
jgi:hypothetical protein